MTNKVIFRTTAFIVAIALFIAVITPVFKLKNYNTFKFNYYLYNSSREKVNVGFFGGSHAYNAFCPAVIYNDYGVKSINYSSSGQPISLTYYVMKEVTKAQKLQVAVVDLYYLGLNSENFEQNGYLHNVIDNFKFSKNKIDAIQNSVKKEDWLTFFIPLIKYHSRWSELTLNDFKKTKGNKFLLGWNADKGYFGEQFNDLKDNKNLIDIPKKSLEYLNLIIELCEANNINLIFTSLPHDYLTAGRPGEWVEDEYAMFNSVKQHLNQKQIDFIFFNDLLDEMNFSPPLDMFNSGHVNIDGSVKVSQYIGKYIRNIYNPEVIDISSDNKWNDYYQQYLNYFEKVTS